MYKVLLRSFKLYMESLKGEEHLFETVYSDLYDKGYFGKELEKDVLREEQYRWFQTFKKILDRKDYDTMIYLLNESDNNRITREWFSKLTGFDLSRKSCQYIEQTVREFCNMELNKKIVLSEWRRYINMSPEEVEKETTEKTRANYFLDKMKGMEGKSVDEMSDSEISYMAKHLRLLKQVKDSKVPMRNSCGEPTTKYNFLKMLGCNPDSIKNG